MIRFMLRTIVFFCLITAACASETLNTLVNASAGFSAAILQQLAAVQNDPTPTEFARKTVACATAQTSRRSTCKWPVQVANFMM
jgi:hypothetical protein